MTLMPILAIPFSIIACHTDMKKGKIRNRNTYPLIILGILTNTYIDGVNGLFFSLEGVIYALFISLLLSSFLKLGGGDVKLLMGYGSLLGRINVTTIFFVFVALSFLASSFIFIREVGLKSFLIEFKTEIRSLGVYKTKFRRKIGGPILLGAYLIALFVLRIR